MFREDYVMRLVRQLSQALTRILFQKDKKQYQDALEEIQHTGKLFFGLDLSAIHTITYDELQEVLVDQHHKGMAPASSDIIPWNQAGWSFPASSRAVAGPPDPTQY